MPDGVRLSTDLYKPADLEPGDTLPVLLEYLPYRNMESRSRNYSMYSYFVAHGYVVASAIAYATGNMVGIYSISTLPRFRRRGSATALVHAAVALRPDLPVSVYPDPPTVPLYTSMGFMRAGEIAAWDKAISILDFRF